MNGHENSDANASWGACGLPFTDTEDVAESERLAYLRRPELLGGVEDSADKALYTDCTERDFPVQFPAFRSS